MNYKIINETVVARIDEDGKSRFSCSIENHEYLEWIAAGNTPLPADPPPVEEQRSAIDAQRDAALNAGFTHDGVLWHCDPTFQAQVQGFILAFSAGVLSTGAMVTIRSKANTNHALTQAQVVALAAALMSHVHGIYATSWAAKDAL